MIKIKKRSEVNLNEKNLKPIRTESEAREKGRNGGIASGKARREKKLMQERVEKLLELSLHKGRKFDAESAGSLDDLSGKNIDVSDAILLKQISKALKGDTTAAAFLRDTAGQKPVEKVMVSDVDPDVIAEVEAMVNG